VVKKLSTHLLKVLNASGIKIQQNNELSGGQEVFHTHFHIIPTYDHVTDNPEPTLTDSELEKLSREIYLKQAI
jgi:histidine triad (HIT) family protein